MAYGHRRIASPSSPFPALVRRISPLVGASNGAAGTISLWFSRVGFSTGILVSIGDGETALKDILRIEINFLGQVQISLRETDGTNVDTLVFLEGGAGAYHHLIVSWDFTAGTLQCWYDGVDESTTFPPPGANWEIADADSIVIGGLHSPSYTFNPNVYLGDLWLDDSGIDLSVTANREKFRDSSGNPVDLGWDGSTPTGSQPLIFLGREMDAAAWNAGTQLGGGGTFPSSQPFHTDVDVYPSGATVPAAGGPAPLAPTLFPAPDTAVVERLSRIPVRSGGLREDYIEHIEALACRFARMTPSEIQDPDERARYLGTLYCATQADIKRGDRVTVRGDTGRVVTVQEPSEADVYQKVALEIFTATTGAP